MKFGVLAFLVAKPDFPFVFSLALCFWSKRSDSCPSLFLGRLARGDCAGVCVRRARPALQTHFAIALLPQSFGSFYPREMPSSKLMIYAPS